MKYSIAFFIALLCPFYANSSPLACEDIFYSVPNKYANKVLPEAKSLAQSLEALGLTIHLTQNPPEQYLFHGRPTTAEFRDYYIREYGAKFIDVSFTLKPVHDSRILLWENFEALIQVQKDVSNYTKKLQNLNPTELANERRRALLVFDKYPQIKTVFEYLEQTYPKDYIPTEYDLKRDFLLQVLKIVKTLPPEFRPKISRIPRDLRTQEINTVARDLIKKQSSHLNNYFQSTGHRDYKSFEKAVRSSKNPELQRALEILDKDQLDFAIRRPESGRFWIPKVGFQNQYITGSSRGALSRELRHEVESIMLNKDKNLYEKMDDELKPKYGVIVPSENSGITLLNDRSKQYGSDIYYLKKDQVKDRVSFFPGDSLDHFHSAPKTSKSFSQLFIPWSKNTLMAPLMTTMLKDSSSFSEPIFDKSIAKELHLSKASWDRHASYYWEFQIFGRLDLTMIEAFKFGQNPPTGEFLAELQRHNIKIIDGRNE